MMRSSHFRRRSANTHALSVTRAWYRYVPVTDNVRLFARNSESRLGQKRLAHLGFRFGFSHHLMRYLFRDDPL